MATSPPYQNIGTPPVPPYYDPSPSGIPPPPPPKPNSNNASRSGTPYNPSQFAPPISPQQQLQQQQMGQVGVGLPPGPGGNGELFIPAVLQDKSRDDLLHILRSQHLLDALYLAHHPSSPQNLTSLTTSLSTNATYAKRLQSLNAAVDHQRATTSSSLLKTRQLERTWREKENEMDVALNRFSARALHARLGQAVGEADAVSRALEESFLEDDGLGDADGDYNGASGGGAGVKASKDVDNFVKSYRGVRALYHLRKERKERWDENRVGGWR
ncbi:hypothetical protein TWF718_000801 [Orbilia javanica]|uniref:VPS37 C-terminal domain-containing protein n=1 Tax=Orbilia javanica TaxID=47235 RepID=A0AAN8RMA1_9PEZI